MPYVITTYLRRDSLKAMETPCPRWLVAFELVTLWLAYHVGKAQLEVKANATVSL